MPRLPAPILLAALALPVAACATVAEPTAACPPSRNWSAFVNAMPGPGARPTLIVTGEVRLARGEIANLEAGPTDRSLPPGQRFALHVGRGDGGGGWQPVRGEIRPALPAYRYVVIGCGGEEIARIDEVTVAH